MNIEFKWDEHDNLKRDIIEVKNKNDSANRFEDKETDKHENENAVPVKIEMSQMTCNHPRIKNLLKKLPTVLYWKNSMFDHMRFLKISYIYMKSPMLAGMRKQNRTSTASTKVMKIRMNLTQK